MTTAFRLRASILLLLCLLSSPARAQSFAPAPLRVLLIVDSSTAVAQMLTPFRAALKAFFEGMPAGSEVVMVSTGGQLKVRQAPTDDKRLWLEAGARFTSDGGANSLLETLLEADKRFFRNLNDRRPEIVVITTDGYESRDEGRLDAYNAFVRTFMARGGRAHGIVLRGPRNGLATDIVLNLTRNTDGFYDSLAIATALPDRMRVLAEAVAADGP